MDDNARTILAETYILPLPVTNRSLGPLVHEICQNSVKLILGTDATRLWKSALPAMIERCRDFEHRSSCKFSTGKAPSIQTTIPKCVCTTIGPEIFAHPIWGKLVTQSTVARLVISPIFAAPFVEESRDFLKQCYESHGVEIRRNIGPDPNKCNLDGCSNEGTKKCVRCQKARYCSRACQVEHWKKTHKTQCEKADQSVPSESSAKAALPTESSKPQAPQARRSVAESPNAPEGRGQRARVTHEIKVRLTYGDLQRLAGRR